MPTKGLTITLQRVSGDSTIYDLGIITDITCTYDVKTSSFPVIIFGYTGAWCMDMGVTKTYQISYTRVSPHNPSDTSSDSTRWSNARWKRMIKSELNSWQAMHDGYRMRITPSDSELYPTSNEIGYIRSFSCPSNAGNISTISGTIDFTIGRLKQDGS